MDSTNSLLCSQGLPLVHILPHKFIQCPHTVFNIPFKIILQSTNMSSKWSLSFIFQKKKKNSKHLSSVPYILCSQHLYNPICFHHPNKISTKKTHYEAPNHANFSTLQLFHHHHSPLPPDFRHKYFPKHPQSVMNCFTISLSLSHTHTHMHVHTHLQPLSFTLQ